ncbi:hypothetical protein GCM10022261_00740 [Brevibacterium daeguense]|uniref:DUF2029 domain-containing protein n=1 Tax=Brevibacterium daeguense TaxID=909936 RepID=A0ABP8EEY4_9MICO|nr:hypothetical protein [Brevibacterium daeguense]
MPRTTPESLARPMLGGPMGSHLASATARTRAWSAGAMMGLLGLSSLLGVLLQAPCLHRGWELPFASYRMCASPLANVMMGTSFPSAPGRASGDIVGFAPVTAWVVELGRLLGTGDHRQDTAFLMVFVMLFNVLAFAAAGIALMLLARDRSWLPVAFLSPVVIFSVGQSLDPVGVALALWALVLLRRDTPGGYSPLAAGMLLALAAFINPLAAVVLLAAVVVGLSEGRGRELVVVGGAWAIIAGILLVADGRLFGRLQYWWQNAIDRGSIASLLSFEPGLNSAVVVLVSVLVWVLSTLTVVIVLMVMAADGRRLSLPAVATVLIGLSLVLMPAAPTVNALWLVPFAVPAVHHLGVQIAWGLSEAGLAMAVSLSDVTALEASNGLAPMWLAAFTLLRVFAIAAVIFCAVERLTEEPAAGGARALADEPAAEGAGESAEARAPRNDSIPQNP